tara:strand:- start:1029 stop:1760 length:732 start_codon:yes stop_codon:yes gene_type:complete
MGQVKLIVSNWKMNLNLLNSTNLIEGLLRVSHSDSIQHIICPQFILIPLVSNLLKGSKINLGAQDCCYEKMGAFTGDTGIELLKEYNCRYVILGHSERRNHHKETNELIKKKVDLAISEGLNPIICIGETIKERKKNNYLEVLENQLKLCIPNEYNEVIIAYEPIWSIGTGLTPSYKEIIEIQNFTEKFLKKHKMIKKLYFLYGGSVNSDNFGEIMNNTNVNGALIGGASLKTTEMKKILTFC